MRLANIALLLVAPLVGVDSAQAKIESMADGIRFTYRNASAQQVFLGGDFNGWSASSTPMTRNGDVFTATVKLNPGEHEYKFVVDGQWFADPENPTSVGSYGNSVLRVGNKGELLELEATSNTALSPKILLGGRYIGLMIGREDPTNQRRFSVSRPDFNIDLDFMIKVSEVLDARAITKIRNLAQNTDLWRTSMQFDRGSLDLHRPSFSVHLFDNDGIGTWDDPLHLVGDIGVYRHDFGFDQQGVRLQTRWAGFTGTALYADNFRSGGVSFPSVPDLAGAAPSVQYVKLVDDNNKNVLALRLERTVGPHASVAASLRNDRGYDPGALARVFMREDSSLAADVFPRTLQRWSAGGVDFKLGGADLAWETFGELLYGEATIRSGLGTRMLFSSPSTLTPIEELADSRFPWDTSQRWIFGGRWHPQRDVEVHASLENERHGLAFGGLAFVRNRALVHRDGIGLRLQDRFHIPVRLGTDLEYFDFDYAAGAPWSSQFWFADLNFWMEHFEHRLPVGRYVQLGGGDASSWSPWLEWTIAQGPPVVFRYEGHTYGGGLGDRPDLIESLFKFTWQFSPRVRFYSDTRWARYDDAVLALDRGFISTFTEVQYRFSPQATVALSYGVDPFILDAVTNEYGEIGRNQFLIDQGASPSAALNRYLNMPLGDAERTLEKERRVQVEAIVRF